MFGATFEPSGGGGDLLKIADVIISGPTPLVSWTGIPQSFIHLKIFGNIATNVAGVGESIGIQCNGDAANNYGGYVAYWNAPLTFSNVDEPVGTVNRARCLTAVGALGGANMFAACECLIPYYTGTANRKSFVSPTYNPLTGIAGGQTIYYFGGMWNSMQAINRIDLFSVSGASFVAGTRLTLYGLG